MTNVIPFTYAHDVRVECWLNTHETHSCAKTRAQIHAHCFTFKMIGLFYRISSLLWGSCAKTRAQIHAHCFRYGVAITSRLLKIMGLFCKRALWKRRYSVKETYHCKEPTNRSHPIRTGELWSLSKEKCFCNCSQKRPNSMCVVVLLSTDHTGWRRPLGCLIIFRKRAL